MFQPFTIVNRFFQETTAFTVTERLLRKQNINIKHLLTMKIFLYEPDETSGELIYSQLTKEGYDVLWIHDYRKASYELEKERFDTSLIEIDDKDNQSGIKLIKEWFNQSKTIREPLCVSIYKTQDTASGFEASKLGSQEIYEIQHGTIDGLDKILRRYKIIARLPQLFIHNSDDFNKAIRDLANLINHNKPVLITGPSGSGKSYLAEHIHKEGTKSDFQYEEIKCGTLSSLDSIELLLGVSRGFRPEIKRDRKGILDEANDKGLLYLEKIHLIHPRLQEVLVDLLERGTYRSVGGTVIKPFKARFIASCEDISNIYNDSFNRRLYELISHNIVRVPSLNDCKSDIIPDAKQIIGDYCMTKGITKEPELTMEAQIMLYTHDWPGNYRELKSCIENAVITCSDDKILPVDLKLTQRTGEELPTDPRGLIIFYMNKFMGKKSDVASAMKISRPTLDKLLGKYGIDYKLFKKIRNPKSKKSNDENR